ncbi:hypothetical protein HXX76_001585 [Chlamydomonas incerta]|uniref:Uncharacterized protein n=1 Tax=Chlamydomonas incerta TaxID=51695 RepID=A0A835WCM7_CHLIN|nr:hypothetical protein HXX76_001585 [Chlamydomonas incerta]|eukprot:KAG2444844.1 hypothetical protein HXX76_001585 [Chlamydomonas incerta]
MLFAHQHGKLELVLREVTNRQGVGAWRDAVRVPARLAPANPSHPFNAVGARPRNQGRRHAQGTGSSRSGGSKQPTAESAVGSGASRSSTPAEQMTRFSDAHYHSSVSNTARSDFGHPNDTGSGDNAVSAAAGSAGNGRSPRDTDTDDTAAGVAPEPTTTTTAAAAAAAASTGTNTQPPAVGSSCEESWGGGALRLELPERDVLGGAGPHTAALLLRGVLPGDRFTLAPGVRRESLQAASASRAVTLDVAASSGVRTVAAAASGAARQGSRQQRRGRGRTIKRPSRNALTAEAGGAAGPAAAHTSGAADGSGVAPSEHSQMVAAPIVAASGGGVTSAAAGVLPALALRVPASPLASVSELVCESEAAASPAGAGAAAGGIGVGGCSALSLAELQERCRGSAAVNSRSGGGGSAASDSDSRGSQHVLTSSAYSSGFPQDEEPLAFHDVLALLGRDGVTGQDVLVIVQYDITPQVLAHLTVDKAGRASLAAAEPADLLESPPHEACPGGRVLLRLPGAAAPVAVAAGDGDQGVAATAAALSGSLHVPARDEAAAASAVLRSLVHVMPPPELHDGGFTAAADTPSAQQRRRMAAGGVETQAAAAAGAAASATRRSGAASPAGGGSTGSPITGRVLLAAVAQAAALPDDLLGEVYQAYQPTRNRARVTAAFSTAAAAMQRSGGLRAAALPSDAALLGGGAATAAGANSTSAWGSFLEPPAPVPRAGPAYHGRRLFAYMGGRGGMPYDALNRIEGEVDGTLLRSDPPAHRARRGVPEPTSGHREHFVTAPSRLAHAQRRDAAPLATTSAGGGADLHASQSVLQLGITAGGLCVGLVPTPTSSSMSARLVEAGAVAVAGAAPAAAAATAGPAAGAAYGLAPGASAAAAGPAAGGALADDSGSLEPRRVAAVMAARRVSGSAGDGEPAALGRLLTPVTEASSSTPSHTTGEHTRDQQADVQPLLERAPGGGAAQQEGQAEPGIATAGPSAGTYAESASQGASAAASHDAGRALMGFAAPDAALGSLGSHGSNRTAGDEGNASNAGAGWM